MSSRLKAVAASGLVVLLASVAPAHASGAAPARAAARRRFVAGAKAWLTYRRADCASRADIVEGGTQAPMVAAQCQAARNATRIRDLRTFKGELASA